MLIGLGWRIKMAFPGAIAPPRMPSSREVKSGTMGERIKQPLALVVLL